MSAYINHSHLLRTRHLRKNEAAQLKKDAINAIVKKKEDVPQETESKVDNNEVNVKSESSTSTNNGSAVAESNKVEGATIGKKKEYTVNVLAEVDNLDTKNITIDPTEFARQERLRKQREKQAKFQQDIVKRKYVESESSKAFKENNLLVEDGADMWEALSQLPDVGNGRYLGIYSRYWLSWHLIIFTFQTDSAPVPSGRGAAPWTPSWSRGSPPVCCSSRAAASDDG